MKTLELYDAVYFLNQCTAIVLEGRYIEPIVSEVEDDFENEFLVLQWEQEHEGLFYTVEVSFKEGDNQTIGIEGSKLFLTNSEGEEEEITLLREWRPLAE